jgi:hypothetical protein
MAYPSRRIRLLAAFNLRQPNKFLVISIGLSGWLRVVPFRGYLFVNAVAELQEPNTPTGSLIASKERRSIWFRHLLKGFKNELRRSSLIYSPERPV